RIVFSAVLGDDDALLQSYLGVGTTILAIMNGYTSRSKPLLIRLLNERNNSWFAESAVPNGPRTWTSALLSAYEAALEELRERLGSDPARWHYGKIHRLTFGHVL